MKTHSIWNEMDREVALDFRDQLREARAIALKDTEAFEAMTFVIERIGVYLTGRIEGLGKYVESIAASASRSPLAESIPAQLPDWHTTFTTLYSLVQHARNDALHEGAFARHLTNNAVELALVLEDALMADAVNALHFMVKDPVCARWWQPISSVRRSMLENSFSFLPLFSEVAGHSAWKLVSDFSLAKYLRESKSNNQRNERLAKQLGKVVEAGDVKLVDASTCKPEECISRVLEVSGGQPVLVIGSNDELRGIITPFDIL
jgi:CBS domain-containing protein